MIKKRTFSVPNDGNQPALDSRSLQCRVNLLDGEEIVQDFSRKVPGHMVLDWVFNTLGILEREYFGLLYWSEKAHMQWLDPLKPLKKQITKTSCRFNFLVKFYAVDPATMKGLTRHLFFLQLKRDIAAGTLSLPEGSTPQILAYILQAELGDLNPLLQRENYISHYHLLPNQTSDIEELAEQEHAKLRGISRKEVIVKFLQRVKWLDGYGLRLFSVKGPKNTFVQLGLSPPGISLYHHGNKTVTYLWTQIVRVSYKSKKFTLSVVKDEEKSHPLVYDLDSHFATKTLWKLTIDMLNFYRSEAENRMVGRDVDSLVDCLEAGSPHPTLNRRFSKGEIQDPKPLLKRNSLPVTRQHGTSVSTTSPDPLPKTVDTDDLVDSIDFKERGIDVNFPPTPPSTNASERGGAVVQPQSDMPPQSVPDVDVAETGVEQYKKLLAMQTALQGSSLRASARRRYRSHLLQYNSNQELSDQPHLSYVLPTEFPTGPTGNTSDTSPTFNHTNRDHSSSPNYVNLLYTNGRLAAVREGNSPNTSEDENDSLVSMQGSSLMSGSSGQLVSKGRNQRPVWVRRTRHDTPPSLSSPPHTPNNSSMQLPWQKNRTKHDDTKFGMRNVQTLSQPMDYVHLRQFSADNEMYSVRKEKEGSIGRPRSSSVMSGREHDIPQTRRPQTTEERADSGKEDGSTGFKSSLSSLKSHESLLKLAETLGYLPSNEEKKEKSTAEKVESQGKDWGKSHDYENLPNEDVVAAITSTDPTAPTEQVQASQSSGGKRRLSGIFRNRSFNVGKKKKRSNSVDNLQSALTTNTKSQSDSNKTEVEIISEVSREVIPSPIPSTDLPPHLEEQDRVSLLERSPSARTVTSLIPPPPEFADTTGDGEGDGVESAETELTDLSDGEKEEGDSADFTSDWTPRVPSRFSTLSRSKSDESISSHTIDRVNRVSNSELKAQTPPKIKKTGSDRNTNSQTRNTPTKASPLSKSIRIPGAEQLGMYRVHTEDSLKSNIVTSQTLLEAQQPEHLYISTATLNSMASIPEGGRDSPDITKEQLNFLSLSSGEQQHSISPSSSPGSKISQFIIPSSSPKLKLLSEDLHTEPLSYLADLVSKQEAKLEQSRKAHGDKDVSTHHVSSEPNLVDPVPKPPEGEVKLGHTTVQGVHGEHNVRIVSKKAENNPEVGRKDWKEFAHLRYTVIGERNPRKKSSATSPNPHAFIEPPPSDSHSQITQQQQQQQQQLIQQQQQQCEEQAKQQPMVPQKQSVPMTQRQPLFQQKQVSPQKQTTPSQKKTTTSTTTPSSTNVNITPNPYPVQTSPQMVAFSQSSAFVDRSHPSDFIQDQQYYDDMINPYAVSRKYPPEELNYFPHLSQSTVGAMEDGRYPRYGHAQYEVVSTTMTGGPPPYQQWSENAVLSQQSGFAPQMRNSYRYHSFQGRSRQVVYNQYRPVNTGPSQPTPIYLHPPSYSQSPSPKFHQQSYLNQLASQEVLSEDDVRSNVSRSGYGLPSYPSSKDNVLRHRFLSPRAAEAQGRDNPSQHGYRPPSRADAQSRDNLPQHGYRPPSQADAQSRDNPPQHGYRPPSRADAQSRDNLPQHGYRPPSRADAQSRDNLPQHGYRPPSRADAQSRDNLPQHGYRPPSRADAQNRDNFPQYGHHSPSRMDTHWGGMLSQDQPVLVSPEPFPLSQPVSTKPHLPSAFNPAFRRSIGSTAANKVRPAPTYNHSPSSPWQYYSNKTPNIPPEKQSSYIRYQGFPHQRKPQRPRAQTPIVLTTPAGSSSLRRSQEALIEEKDDEKVSYYIL